MSETALDVGSAMSEAVPGGAASLPDDLTAAAPATRHIPLAVARRRYGQTLLLLTLLGLLALAALLLAQVPPSLRADTAALILVLAVVCLGTGLLALLWTWIIVWPRERKRLAGATTIERLSELPPSRERATAALRLAVGGVLVGALLWTVLNTVGFVAAPLLWITLATINLETARRVRGVERRRGDIYYDVPALALFGAVRRLYVLSMP